MANSSKLQQSHIQFILKNNSTVIHKIPFVPFKCIMDCETERRDFQDLYQASQHYLSGVIRIKATPWTLGPGRADG